MCLIISGPSNTMRSTLLGTAGLVESIFKSNSDGLGLMYRNKRGLKVIKALPKTSHDFRNIIENMPDDNRTMALHARMQTHGKIDTLNCHPYTVVRGVVELMHNGILDTGNEKDKTRSDTYHFVQDFLAGLVGKYPEIIHDEGFLSMLGDNIGNNRFVFMDNEGKLSIVNRDQGIEHGDLWFANTYAWDPELLIKGYKSRWSGRYKHTNLTTTTGISTHQADLDAYRAAWDGYDDVEYETWKSARNGSRSWGPNRESAFVESIINGDVDAVADTLEDFADDALVALFDRFAIMENRHTDSVTDFQAEIVEALVEQDMPTLREHCRQRPEVLADVLCFYVDVLDLTEWDGQQDEGDEYEGDDISYYMQHCITVSEDDTGWGYTIENENDGVIHAAVQFDGPHDARRAAIQWLDANAVEAA